MKEKKIEMERDGKKGRMTGDKDVNVCKVRDEGEMMRLEVLQDG